ncbi:S28 family serine protease [Streptomyces acidiscabies]|uniref:S28 family serine protease n=1 Tax=Streptomyces acidiscabies TaxID=42234 RepID=A0AAP6EEE0_9ACTN|nr:S28 family serine protease [Streptomyces acidiscabies]MBP5939480.1 aminopeptidase [Streptomyces sp. LBUM 1476]MBZ3910629.1 aminopeptidase [Streptomyces acidiscabies]MDX2959629.1 S28 family serine protease [Streptomyces acidiscabies]MDX3019083.1 S28 family serine protease [Streptomyces acidiscabies]MDX3790836.1 S28 family serine protease [Streptomyces acidiscabies]
MRKALRWLLALMVLISTLGTATAATAAEPEATDIKDQLLAIPGMSLVQEKPYPGYRFFVLNYTQPVDHRRPAAGTFEQRITVLHKDVNRPTVFYTGGYSVSTTPGRREPTQIVDGNQVSMEYRYFTPSRPAEPADWSKLTIWQAASDQHRIFEALKPIYSKKWLSTGGSKGGMTATYYERFYPRDMDGVVAYVAPNDVVNDEDSAYDRFFATVGTKECRDRLNGVQREALVRREPLEKRYAAYAADNGYTFGTVGSLDKAYEAVVLDYVWGFWQYSLLGDCDTIPADAKNATDDEIWNSVDTISGFSFYTDQGLTPYTPYYFQAASQLGAPTIHFPHIERKYVRYGYQPPSNFVPDSVRIPRFDRYAMADVDNWVRHNARRMLFVYGQNDPWGAERFRVGKGAKDSYVLTAPGLNHGANVAGLVPDEKAFATSRILEWAGVSASAVEAAKPLARFDAKLDVRDVEREPALRP